MKTRTLIAAIFGTLLCCHSANAQWVQVTPNVAANATTHEKPPSTSDSVPGRAEYAITLDSVSPLRISVSARVPMNGRMLEMDHTYPADLPDMAAKGWPALISNLLVQDAAGKQIEVTAAGIRGWQLSDSVHSLLKLTYDVDYDLFAASGWSSSLESAFADDDNAIVVGRSVFVTTAQTSDITVEIVTPEDWIAVVPWTTDTEHRRQYSVVSTQDLTNNMLVFSKNEPDVVTSAGFEMRIVPMGHWQSLRPLVRQVLKTIVTGEVNLMGYKAKETYTVVLLPISDEGGNAFHQSFVYCYTNPDQNNTGIWANALAHEIFHYWNYSILKGADYRSSQWFQEGFTEYVANLVLVTGRIIDSDAFVGKLSEHVKNCRQLTTTLENIGSQKGPPLYSAGALVAFMWDVKIREATDGKHSIGDFFRNLMAQTDSGVRPYTWIDIKAALHNTADADWEAFYQSYIKGHEPLPLDTTLSSVGLRLTKLADGSEQVEYDPAASFHGKDSFRELIGD